MITSPQKKWLQKKNAVVGVVATEEGLSLLCRATLPCDLVELRLDYLLEAQVPVEKISAVLKKRRQAVLLTARHDSEGGVRHWRRAERLAVLRELLPHADALDVELAKISELQPLRKEFPSVAIILSAHDFRETPRDEILATLLERMLARKADVLKVACHCGSAADLGRLAVLQYLNRELPLALMGMGELGAVSRTMLPRLGARLVYAYLDKATAPGQPSALELKRRLAQGL